MSNYPIITLDELSRAYNKSTISAIFKQSPEDFNVNESLSFEPCGQGTHAYLLIQKERCNTLWVAEQLAKFTGNHIRQIGYAGLKDRQAKTTQWFSINLEGIQEPDWDQLNIPNVKLIQQTYHTKKLKIGCIKINHFTIRLKEISETNFIELNIKLEQIKQDGYPNYFGPQRFGHDYNNIKKAEQWFEGKYKVKQKSKQSFYLSAVRSMLFNALLSQRIQHSGWLNLMPGEVMILDGSRSFFTVSELDLDIHKRFKQGDIHPSLCLWGTGELDSCSELKLLEQNLKTLFPDWTQGLENKKLVQDRRALRIIPKQMKWHFIAEKEYLVLEFSLPTGSYATSLLRELCSLQD